MDSIFRTIFAIPTAFAQTEKVAGVATETTNQFQLLINSIFGAIPLWITGFIIIVFSFILAKILKGTIENKMTAAGFEEEHKEIQIVTGRATSAIVMTLGVTIGLKVAGIDITAIVAAAAFGIGFAMRDIIMNFLAGIIVLLQKQFTIGDWIVVKGTAGIVQEIQSRYTVLKKFDGTKVIIPNGDLFKNQVTNLTGNPFRRFQIDLGVDLYYDLKDTIDLIYKSIEKVPRILLSPKPSIIVTQPGAFYNNLRIRCWVDSKRGTLKAVSALVRQMHKDFYAQGLSWPYPIQTVIMDKDDAPNNAAGRHQAYMELQKKKKTVVARATSGTQPPLAMQTIPAMAQAVPQPVAFQPAQAVNAQAANPPIIINRIDAGPGSEKVDISIMSAPQPAQSVAPQWLQKAAQTATQGGQNLTIPQPSVSADQTIPVVSQVIQPVPQTIPPVAQEVQPIQQVVQSAPQTVQLSQGTPAGT